MKAISIIAACAALIGAGAVANASPYLITVEQVGTNVVATGSGQIDLDGLTLLLSDVQGIQGINPSFGFVGVGTANAQANVYVFPRNGPASFGSGAGTTGSSFSGVVANIDGTSIPSPASPYRSVMFLTVYWRRAQRLSTALRSRYLAPRLAPTFGHGGKMPIELHGSDWPDATSGDTPAFRRWARLRRLSDAP